MKLLLKGKRKCGAVEVQDGAETTNIPSLTGSMRRDQGPAFAAGNQVPFRSPGTENIPKSCFESVASTYAPGPCPQRPPSNWRHPFCANRTLFMKRRVSIVADIRIYRQGWTKMLSYKIDGIIGAASDAGESLFGWTRWRIGGFRSSVTVAVRP